MNAVEGLDWLVRTMGREWASPKIGTLHTGLRAKDTVTAAEISVDIVRQEYAILAE
jgi:hypothetical protein